MFGLNTLCTVTIFNYRTFPLLISAIVNNSLWYCDILLSNANGHSKKDWKKNTKKKTHPNRSLAIFYQLNGRNCSIFHICLTFFHFCWMNIVQFQSIWTKRTDRGIGCHCNFSNTSVKNRTFNVTMSAYIICFFTMCTHPSLVSLCVFLLCKIETIILE